MEPSDIKAVSTAHIRAHSSTSSGISQPNSCVTYCQRPPFLDLCSSHQLKSYTALIKGSHKMFVDKSNRANPSSVTPNSSTTYIDERSASYRQMPDWFSHCQANNQNHQSIVGLMTLKQYKNLLYQINMSTQWSLSTDRDKYPKQIGQLLNAVYSEFETITGIQMVITPNIQKFWTTESTLLIYSLISKPLQFPCATKTPRYIIYPIF